MTAAQSAPLWDWAVAAYGAPGVSEACVALQDNHEQNVPVLLWSAWIAATGRNPDAETIEAACDTARAWDSVVVAPLRAIRRTLKAPIPDIDDEPRQAVRDRVKALELLAERHLLEALEALASEAPTGSPRPFVEALVATARVWAQVTPRPALIRLADALPA
ncbi:MAG: TIGR02444 family protein [Alphaproteobacteria bacterium]|uniref:TIGR02444 family protein n=1 Tax=Brevundimonas mediterranea TaxID=74329 RepID=A0A7Z8Y1F4_9CAUL|nr:MULTISPECIES: TIGR02444 family protein [Brevundimonas]MBU1272872.1 TIGR02444 family protein [Alphaproteobacteria bacterium]MBJ7320465.1 TIGR02444 family protein [Brevundimonas sp.]MBU1521971.1 TIGR02444 family protein [Alphaproteobacteria bacterium]MBU2031805.1 TIGR02444 family protein [Alphaproteobacteria bacterium]MBU2165996.1 TIGR02444 family protein [Alphaproteobacteria bacterium]